MIERTNSAASTICFEKSSKTGKLITGIKGHPVIV
jgi:hypothetical protein